jgi:Family of unknown function (DUF6356)
MCWNHLHKKNITYFKHLQQAWEISFKMGTASIACFIHGLFPDVFQTTATDIAKDITRRFLL